MKIPDIKEYNGFPVVTSEKMKYIDRIATLDFGITSQTLMENAGRNISKEVIEYIKENLKKDLKDIKVSIFCGRGNNGGDGLVCARYLKENGANVKVYIVKPSEKGYSELVVKNLERAKNIGINIKMIDFDDVDNVINDVKDDDIFIDALLGVSTVGKPTGVVKRLIQIMNKAKKNIIAVDIPSGINPDTGHHTGVYVIAKLTLTLGLPKSGLMAPHAQKNIGVLKVVDIGFPKELIEKIRFE